MKHLSIILTLFVSCTLLSCKNEILLVSSVKEITIPGRPNQSQIVNYKLQFQVTKDNQNIKINEITFPLLGIKNESLKYDIMDQSSNMIIKNITKKGTYLLNIKPNDEFQSQIISSKKDEILISLVTNTKKEQIKISSFVEKTKRIR